jgi:hypothetical protein
VDAPEGYERASSCPSRDLADLAVSARESKYELTYRHEPKTAGIIIVNSLDCGLADAILETKVLMPSQRLRQGVSLLNPTDLHPELHGLVLATAHLGPQRVVRVRGDYQNCVDHVFAKWSHPLRRVTLVRVTQVGGRIRHASAQRRTQLLHLRLGDAKLLQTGSCQEDFDPRGLKHAVLTTSAGIDFLKKVVEVGNFGMPGSESRRAGYPFPPSDLA